MRVGLCLCMCVCVISEVKYLRVTYFINFVFFARLSSSFLFPPLSLI